MGNVGYPVAIAISSAFGIASSIAALLPDVTAASRLCWGLSVGVIVGVGALKYRQSRQED